MGTFDRPIPRRSHVRRPLVVAAPHPARVERAGRPVVAGWTCSTGHPRAPYRYAATGECRGACHVKEAKGRSSQPHEYIVCGTCGPVTAICLTHSRAYGDADAHFREQERRTHG